MNTILQNPRHMLVKLDVEWCNPEKGLLSKLCQFEFQASEVENMIFIKFIFFVPHETTVFSRPFDMLGLYAALR